MTLPRISETVAYDGHPFNVLDYPIIDDRPHIELSQYPGTIIGSLTVPNFGWHEEWEPYPSRFVSLDYFLAAGFSIIRMPLLCSNHTPPILDERQDEARRTDRIESVCVLQFRSLRLGYTRWTQGCAKSLRFFPARRISSGRRQMFSAMLAAISATMSRVQSGSRQPAWRRPEMMPIGSSRFHSADREERSVPMR
jgi:hypothetical protein